MLSIVNLSESAFRHKTKVLLLSNRESIASHEHDDAEDYINSMTQTQNQSTAIKSHLNQDYAFMPKPIRNPESMQFIAEPQTIPNLIDVSIDDSNYIFSTLSESELTAKEYTSFILHLNTVEDDDDDYTSPYGLTTFNKSLDGSNDFTISRDG